MDQAAKDQPQVRRVGRPPKVKPQDGAELLKSALSDGDVRALSQSLASRIWEGQSPDLPRAERLCRVKAGVEAQGMSMEGVTL